MSPHHMAAALERMVGTAFMWAASVGGGLFAFVTEPTTPGTVGLITAISGAVGGTLTLLIHLRERGERLAISRMEAEARIKIRQAESEDRIKQDRHELVQRIQTNTLQIADLQHQLAAARAALGQHPEAPRPPQ